MRFEITLEIPTSSETVCRSILDAVEPDNVSAPKGIYIEMECKDKEMIINVKSENVSVLTFRNTVDDILAHISIAMKSISSINERALL